MSLALILDMVGKLIEGKNKLLFTFMFVAGPRREVLIWKWMSVQHVGQSRVQVDALQALWHMLLVMM